MRAIEIRSPRQDDADAVASLLGELGYPTTPEQVPERLVACEPPAYAVRLAVIQGRVVGLIALHRIASLHLGAPGCYITALIISGAVRRQGIGRRLLEEAESWARANGCNRITVTSANHRDDAHSFYENSGFPQTGRRFVKQL